MSSISGDSLKVLKSFIDGANAQYRKAGLAEYQMQVDGAGRVTTPGAPSAAAAASAPQTSAPTPSASASTGGQQASQGAQATSASGAAPKISDLQQGADGAFKVSWGAVEGASSYGVYQDGQLIGHVPAPSFAGKLANGATGTMQFDAVLADGSRTQQTPALLVARGADGVLKFDAPGAAKQQAAAGAAATAAAA